MAKIRILRHVGFIPDGNRRWAAAHSLPKEAGYAYGVGPGLILFGCACPGAAGRVSGRGPLLSGTKASERSARREDSPTGALQISRGGTAENGASPAPGSSGSDPFRLSASSTKSSKSYAWANGPSSAKPRESVRPTTFAPRNNAVSCKPPRRFESVHNVGTASAAADSAAEGEEVWLLK